MEMLDSLGVDVKAGASEDPAPTTTTTTPGMPTPPLPKVEVVKRVPVEAGKLKCSKAPPDCGLLNDKMSLMWGKYKDLVDELKQEMEEHAFEFQELQANFNEQLSVLRNSKARFT